MTWQDHFYIRELQATVRINYDIFRKAPDCMNQAYILDEIESSSSILQGGKVNKNSKKIWVYVAELLSSNLAYCESGNRAGSV